MFPEILLHSGEMTALSALVAARPQGLHHAVDVLCVQGQAWKWSKNKQNKKQYKIKRNINYMYSIEAEAFIQGKVQCLTQSRISSWRFDQQKKNKE